jgi:CheY-like chemotaxis protein
MQAIGQLTGGIAHDFNNMLAIVIGSLEMARRRLAGTENTAVLKAIDSAAEGANRAALLTARLLAFSRQQPLEPSVFDANKLVAGMSELLRRSLGETIELEAVLSGGLWRAFADPAQLESALVNLAVNARDAMSAGGKLTIETANAELDDRYAAAQSEVAAGQYVMISVTDTGVGMPPGVIERAFDPFFTTKGPGKGTGLGLSQVFGFVKQSAGHVKIYSERGHGTTVKIYLPRSSSPAAEAEVERPQPQRDGAADKTILVVEDEAAVRDMTVAALRELGYTVIPAASPKEALRQINSRTDIALLLTDIVLPEMNGRQLAEIAHRRCLKSKSCSRLDIRATRSSTMALSTQAWRFSPSRSL